VKSGVKQGNIVSGGDRGESLHGKKTFVTRIWGVVERKLEVKTRRGYDDVGGPSKGQARVRNCPLVPGARGRERTGHARGEGRRSRKNKKRGRVGTFCLDGVFGKKEGGKGKSSLVKLAG